MKRTIALLLALVGLLVLTACTQPVPTETETLTLPTLPIPETTAYIPREEDTLLGLWTNDNGLSLRFTREGNGAYRYELRAEQLQSGPETGAYAIRDGVLLADGYAGQEEIEFTLEGDKLTLELRGNSFTLTRQEEEHAP